MSKIGLTLGPVLFNWDADRLRAFYKDIAETSKFDRVHLCEVVCGKRTPFTDAVWPDAMERLEAAGKQVVLSTLGAAREPARTEDRRRAVPRRHARRDQRRDGAARARRPAVRGRAPPQRL